MKLSLLIFILTLIPILNAQEWRDSLNVARNAYKKGDFQKALKYYKSAQKKAPKEIDLSDEMGQSAYKLREFQKAEKIYNQSSSKLNKKKKSIAYHNIGNTKMQQKNYQGAIDSYKEALKNNPNDEETRYNLSEAIRRLKDQQKKNDSKQNQNKNKDNKDNKKNQNNKNDQDQNNSNSSKNQNKQQNQSKNQNNSKNNSAQNKSNLPNKSVDRLLDKLAKQEAETKKRANSKKGENLGTVSGKDW